MGGQLFTALDLGKVRGMAQHSLLHLFAVLFHDVDRDQLKDGFIGPASKPEVGDRSVAVEYRGTGDGEPATGDRR